MCSVFLEAGQGASLILILILLTLFREKRGLPREQTTHRCRCRQINNCEENDTHIARNYSEDRHARTALRKYHPSLCVEIDAYLIQNQDFGKKKNLKRILVLKSDFRV